MSAEIKDYYYDSYGVGRIEHERLQTRGRRDGPTEIDVMKIIRVLSPVPGSLARKCLCVFSFYRSVILRENIRILNEP